MIIDIDWFIHYNSVVLLVINILCDWVTVSNRNHYKGFEPETLQVTSWGGG